MPYRWELVTMTAPFAPRDGAGALTLNGRMYLLGGWNPGDKVNFPRICNSEVWCSTDGLHWTEINEQAPWEGRHCAGWIEHRDRLWVVGGDCNQGHYQNDVWHSSDGVTWTQACDDVPWRNRALHMTHAFADKLWVLGGQTMPGFVSPGPPEAFFNDVWCSEDGVNWTRVLEHAPWPPRGMVAGHAVFQDRLWLIAGGTYDTPTTPQRKFYNDVWSTADGENWICHTERADFAPRQYHETAVWDGRLWVMEGSNRGHVEGGGNLNDVWHSGDGESWKELPGTPWKSRHAASLFMHDDALWMVAGNNMEPDVWKLVRT